MSQLQAGCKSPPRRCAGGAPVQGGWAGEQGDAHALTAARLGTAGIPCVAPGKLRKLTVGRIPVSDGAPSAAEPRTLSSAPGS